MKKIALISVLLVGLVVVAAAPSEAWHGYHYHSRVYFGFGPYAPYPYWYYPYYPPYAYAPPPVVVQSEPPVYVQRPAAPPPAPPAPPPPPAAAAAPEAYWHYCASAKGYYPDVSTCPEPWVKVAPRP